MFTSKGTNVVCVVLLEQEAARRELMSALLHTLGHTVVARDSAESAVAAAADHQPQAVLIGSMRRRGAREDVAAELRRCCPSAAITFLQVPEADRELHEWRTSESPPAPLPRPPPPLEGEDDRRLVGLGSAAQHLRSAIASVAGCDSSVLITGETGTGKDLIAELIHRNSKRRLGPWVAINGAAVPEPLFESELFGHEKGAFTGAASAQVGKLAAARGGTLFLDEIGELSPASQAKLLRVIENRTFYPLGSTRPQQLEVRIIAATNEDVERAVELRRFRRDLFYRLNVVRIEVPPLRDRREDIPDLCTQFLTEFNRQFGARFESISRETLDLLMAHDWPGNVRELRNTIEGAFALSGDRRTVQLTLPAQIVQRLHVAHDRKALQLERTRLLEALEKTSWNKRRAARDLAMSRMTLYRKMKALAIEREARQSVPATGP